MPCFSIPVVRLAHDMVPFPVEEGVVFFAECEVFVKEAEGFLCLGVCGVASLLAVEIVSGSSDAESDVNVACF